MMDSQPIGLDWSVDHSDGFALKCFEMMVISNTVRLH